MKLLPKQENAVYYLKDSVTEEVLYGGAAGGGKSAFGCMWLIENCQKFPGSRWLMGRSKLDTLKATTLKSFFEIASKLGVTDQYNYNAQAKTIYWYNGSEIILKDLFLYPSDANFDSLGSLEITGAFIDECNQLVYKAWQVVKSRIRFKLNEWDISGVRTDTLVVNSYNSAGIADSWVMPNGSITRGLIPKILGSCNPAKNWVYSTFYLPKKKKELKDYQRFIQALPTDNPHLAPSYLKTLQQLDDNSKQRLFHGNWEYDSDPAALITFDNIQSVFKDRGQPFGTKYITSDIAREGRDKTVIGLWSGMRLLKRIEIAKNKVTEAAEVIRNIASENYVSNHNIICDEDGVGGGVVDILLCRGFVNNSKPLKNPVTGEDENYQHLKAQMYYKLASVIQAGEMYLDIPETDTRDSIVAELEQVKAYNMDKDGKKQVLPKDKIKELLGRSPDDSDMLMMRMWFEYIPEQAEVEAGW